MKFIHFISLGIVCGTVLACFAPGTPPAFSDRVATIAIRMAHNENYDQQTLPDPNPDASADDMRAPGRGALPENPRAVQMFPLPSDSL